MNVAPTAVAAANHGGEQGCHPSTQSPVTLTKKTPPTTLRL